MSQRSDPVNIKDKEVEVEGELERKVQAEAEREEGKHTQETEPRLEEGIPTGREEVDNDRESVKNRENLAIWQDMLAQIDKLMCKGQYEEAHALVPPAWVQMLKYPCPDPEDLDRVAEVFWYFISAIELDWLTANYNAMRESITLLFQFVQGTVNEDRSNGLVIGNPLFHMKTAQMYFVETSPHLRQVESKGPNAKSQQGKEAKDNDDNNTAADLADRDRKCLNEIARAVYSAGLEVLRGEDLSAYFVQLVKDKLRVPAGYSSWEESMGPSGYAQPMQGIMLDYPFNSSTMPTYWKTLLEAKFKPSEEE